MYISLHIRTFIIGYHPSDSLGAFFLDSVDYIFCIFVTYVTNHGNMILIDLCMIMVTIMMPFVISPYSV